MSKIVRQSCAFNKKEAEEKKNRLLNQGLIQVDTTPNYGEFHHYVEEQIDAKGRVSKIYWFEEYKESSQTA